MHLTDRSEDSSSPQERMKLARTLIRERLLPQGHLILLTGTPHQGHEFRFRNLLRLLSSDGKTEAEARGRVIYRIKDDIRDWNGQPLFPVRRVNPPTLVEVTQVLSVACICPYALQHWCTHNGRWLASCPSVAVVRLKSGAWPRLFGPFGSPNGDD